MGIARGIHLVVSHWAFLLMSFHLGLHMTLLQAKFSVKQIKMMNSSLFIVAIYGLYAMWKYDVLSYMFYQNQYMYYDFQQSLLYFYLNYLSMAITWIVMAMFLLDILKKLQRKGSV